MNVKGVFISTIHLLGQKGQGMNFEEVRNIVVHWSSCMYRTVGILGFTFPSANLSGGKVSEHYRSDIEMTTRRAFFFKLDNTYFFS